MLTWCLTGVGNCESFATRRDLLDYPSSNPLIGELVHPSPNCPNPYSDWPLTVKCDLLLGGCSALFGSCSGVGGAS